MQKGTHLELEQVRVQFEENHEEETAACSSQDDTILDTGSSQ